MIKSPPTENEQVQDTVVVLVLVSGDGLISFRIPIQLARRPWKACVCIGIVRRVLLGASNPGTYSLWLLDTLQ